MIFDVYVDKLRLDDYLVCDHKPVIDMKQKLFLLNKYKKYYISEINIKKKYLIHLYNACDTLMIFLITDNIIYNYTIENIYFRKIVYNKEKTDLIIVYEMKSVRVFYIEKQYNNIKKILKFKGSLILTKKIINKIYKSKFINNKLKLIEYDYTYYDSILFEIKYSNCSNIFSIKKTLIKNTWGNDETEYKILLKINNYRLFIFGEMSAKIF